MTTTLDRHAALDDAPGTRAQLWARGVLAAFSVTAVGIAVMVVLCLVAWAADPRSGATAGDATRVAISLWLLVFRAPLHVTGGTVSLPPLALTVAVVVALRRSARTLGTWWSGLDVVDLRVGAGRGGPEPTAALEVVASIALPLAVISTTLATCCQGPGLRPSTAGAFAGAAVVGGLATALGVVGIGPAGRRLQDRGLGALPSPVRNGLAGAARAGLVLIAGAAVTLLASFLWHLPAAGRDVSHAGGGVIGTVGMVVVCLALLPNAVIATLGYLAGPGLSVGTGSAVSAGSVHLAGLPPLPLLAAVPHGPAPVAVRLAMWTLIAAAGVAAALLPRTGPVPLLDACIRAAVAAGVVALMVLAVVAVAGGPAGPGWLATVGASSWRTGLAVLSELVAAGLIAVIATTVWELLPSRRDA